MRWQRTMLAGATLGGVAVLVLLGTLDRNQVVADEKLRSPAEVPHAGHADDEKAIRATAAAYAKAFAAGDAKALAALWTADGDYCDEQGHAVHGRAAIEKDFADFFATNRGLTLDVGISSIRFLGNDVAIEDGTASVRLPSGEPASSARYTAVHVRRDGKWLMASVRDTRHKTASNYDHLKDVEWLIGRWDLKAGDMTGESSNTWSGNRNYITRTFSMRMPDGTTVSGTQIITWDPILGRIRSWQFDSEGGFGSEVWSREGKSWVLEATGVRRDGSQTEATNIVTPSGPDGFTWQSVRRTLNGAALPDTAAIKVTRVAAKK